MHRDWLKAGTSVPYEGVYRVHHYQHRLAHLVTIKYLHFPQCDRCGDRVLYEPALILEVCPVAPFLKDDPDFQNSTRHIARKQDAQTSSG